MKEYPTAKFYYASVMAIRDSPEVAGKVDAYHLPTVIGPINSISDAKKIACEYALKEFPLASGWSEHNTAVIPATNEVMQLLKTTQLLLKHGDLIAPDPKEEGQRFFCGLTADQSISSQSEETS
jgi:hypothetical protein